MSKNLYCIIHKPTGLFLDHEYEPHWLDEGITNWVLQGWPGVFPCKRSAREALVEALDEVEKVGGISRDDHPNTPCTADDLQIMRLIMAPL
jgi:hypothetical protein